MFKPTDSLAEDESDGVQMRSSFQIFLSQRGQVEWCGELSTSCIWCAQYLSPQIACFMILNEPSRSRSHTEHLTFIIVLLAAECSKFIVVLF